jgi:hypothetical protein
MHAYGLAQTIVLGRGAAGFMACFALLAFCGLLRPLQRRGRVRLPPRGTRPKNAPNPTVKLNAIELGLLAELSLEQARAHEELVDDPTVRPETRRKAAAVATAWRERAQVFQAHARRQSAAPIIPGDPAYTGPERRNTMRRCETRRTGPGTSARRPSGDRRSLPDRRQDERRRPALAPR